ncbi:terminase small subunit [Psychrobacter pocilloporae]|uniref:terminase small subunit n=1 Tax=Psychrobacter pocilloporae TaxID=1775882 RepID=UPI003C2C0F32
MNDDTPHGVASESNAGRKSSLTPELITKAKLYINEFREGGFVLPTVEGLAYYLGVARSSVYKYEGENSEFSDIVETVRQLQAIMLINGGLMGDFNASIAKVMMTKHGYSDKQEIDNTSSDGSMKPVFNIVGVSPDDNSASGDSTE